MHQAHLRQQAENQLLEQVLQCAEHQLRNPLALISLYAENLYLGLSAEAQKQQVALIREATAQLTESVSNLLACGQVAATNCILQCARNFTRCCCRVATLDSRETD